MHPLLLRGKPPEREAEPRPPVRAQYVGVAAVGALVAVLVGAILVSIRHSPTTRVPTSPVLGPARVVYEGDIGDPVVMPVTSKGGAVSFVAFGTGDRRARVPTAHSADLTTWQQGPDALPVLPDWTAPDPRHSRSWAPAVLDTGHGYVLYVSLPDARSGQQCIGAASSSTPEGPYHGVGDGPLICQHELGGSIDPAVARDRDGSLHLFWKDDANALGQPTSLWEQKLSGDGLGLVGTAHRLLTASRPWQGGIIEEPAVIAASGAGWWLFYSGNSFDRPEYATGLAFCPTIVGPCREVSDEPFLATPALSQDAQFAPGGLETVRDARGGLWAVFDTWNRPARDGRFHCCRSLQMAPLVSH